MSFFAANPADFISKKLNVGKYLPKIDNDISVTTKNPAHTTVDTRTTITATANRSTTAKQPHIDPYIDPKLTGWKKVCQDEAIDQFANKIGSKSAVLCCTTMSTCGCIRDGCESPVTGIDDPYCQLMPCSAIELSCRVDRNLTLHDCVELPADDAAKSDFRHYNIVVWICITLIALVITMVVIVYLIRRSNKDDDNDADSNRRAETVGESVSHGDGNVRIENQDDKIINNKARLQSGNFVGGGSSRGASSSKQNSQSVTKNKKKNSEKQKTIKTNKKTRKTASRTKTMSKQKTKTSLKKKRGGSVGGGGSGSHSSTRIKRKKLCESRNRNSSGNSKLSTARKPHQQTPIKSDAKISPSLIKRIIA